MLQDLILFQKIYDFILWFHPVLRKFPQSQRFVLAQRIENKVLDILNSIIWANAENEKAPFLKKASIQLDELRILIRLSKDLKFINLKQYETSAERINEIGRILSGFMSKFSR